MHKGDRVLVCNIIVAANRRYGFKIRSGMLGSILDLNVGSLQFPVVKILFLCPPPYKFKKSPYKQVLYGNSQIEQ
jgi:hypothetical protein